MLGYAIAIVRKLKINHKNFGGYSDENEQKSSRYFISSNEYDDFLPAAAAVNRKRRLIMRQQAVRSLLSPVRMEAVHAVPL